MKASCTMASRLITMIQSGSLCAFWSIDECCKLYMEQFCPCQEWTGLCLAAREDCVTGCVPCWTLGSWATACLVMATWSAIQTEVFKKWMISILSHQIACWNTRHFSHFQTEIGDHSGALILCGHGNLLTSTTFLTSGCQNEQVAKWLKCGGIAQCLHICNKQ